MTRSDSAPLVVVGDTLLDVDLVGRADRLAPDAPVPVVAVEAETARPGGAGLAALLARRLSGRPVVLVTPLAADDDGERLRTLLEEHGVTVVPLPHDGTTTVKQRVLAQRGPLLRIDRGGPLPEIGPLPEEAVAAIAGAGAVLVSDYGTGTTSSEAVRTVLTTVTVPLVWDPHPRGAEPVRGATLVTPNEAELRALSDEPPGGSSGATALADVTSRAGRLVQAWRARGVAVTLGARGALLSSGDGPPTLVPPPRLPIDGQDPCGAGDCFAAAAALSLAGGSVLSEAVQDAVAAASRFVHDGGAAAVTARGNNLRAPRVQGSGRESASARAPAPGRASPTSDPGSTAGAAEVVEQVRARGGTVVATGGCFDLLHAGHVATLQAARSLGDCLVVLLNSDESVRRLKGPTRPIQPEDDRARVLAALDAVDAVAVFAEDTPVEALRRLRPDVWTKGGDYSVEQLPEAEVLREWGGQVVVLPYLDGRSTTRLVQYAGTTGG